MSVCDWCNTSLSQNAQISLPALTVHSAVRNGISQPEVQYLGGIPLPSDFVWQMAGGGSASPEERTALWRAQLLADHTSWNVCRACATEIGNAASQGNTTANPRTQQRLLELASIVRRPIVATRNGEDRDASQHLSAIDELRSLGPEARPAYFDALLSIIEAEIHHISRGGGGHIVLAICLDRLSAASFDTGQRELKRIQHIEASANSLSKTPYNVQVLAKVTKARESVERAIEAEAVRRVIQDASLNDSSEPDFSRPAISLVGTVVSLGILLFIGWIYSGMSVIRKGNSGGDAADRSRIVNHVPRVEVSRCDPHDDLLEGNTLTVELNGRDEDGDRLTYEYQHSGRSDWLRAEGRSASIPDLPRGEFRATFRASDGRGLYSEPITRTWSVAENPWNEWQDIGYGKAPAQTIRGSSREFGCLALSPDGWNVAVGHGSAGVICRVSDGGFVRRFSEQSTLITNVEFSPNGFLLASRDYNNTIRLWNAFSGELLQAFDGKDNRTTALAIDRDGKLIANGGADGTVRLWSVADGRSTQTLTATTSPVTSLVFSPDLSTLASANQDGTIRLWNALDGSLLHTWSAHRAEVKCLVFDASGQSLASGSADGKAMLWRIPEGTQSGEMAGHTGRVNCVAFHPDGTTLATGGSDRSLRLWRISDGRMVRVLEGHASEIVSIAFSPDGLRLFSCDRAGPTKLWSTQSLSASKPVSMPSYQSVQDAQLLQIHSMGNELPDLFELSKEDSEILREAATEEFVGRWRDFEDRVQKAIDQKVSAIREIIDAFQEREGRRPLSDATRERIELERQLELLDIEKAIARVNGQSWQLWTNIRADAAAQSKWNGILARQQELEVALASAKRAVAAHRQSTEAAKAAFLFAMQNSFPSQWLDAIPPNIQGTREDAKFMREKIATIRRLPTNSNGIRVHVNDILERIEEIGLRVGGPLDERLAAVSQEQTDFLLTNGELLRSLRNDLREIGESLKKWQSELEVVRGQRDELWKRRQQVQAP